MNETKSLPVYEQNKMLAESPRIPAELCMTPQGVVILMPGGMDWCLPSPKQCEDSSVVNELANLNRLILSAFRQYTDRLTKLEAYADPVE